MNQEQKEQLDVAIDTLKDAGAEGIWIIRGVADATMIYRVSSPDSQPVVFRVNPPCDMLILARFPSGDGRTPGIEHR